MKILYKFYLILIIGQKLALASSTTGPFPLRLTENSDFHKRDYTITMVKAIRNGQNIFAPKKMLELMEQSGYKPEAEYYPSTLQIYFWTAVHNGYHIAAYTIGEHLFIKHLSPCLRPFPQVIGCCAEDTNDLISTFYAIMEELECNDLSSEDRQCFHFYKKNLLAIK